MANRIEQALSSGKYATATSLWGQLESLIEGVCVHVHSAVSNVFACVQVKTMHMYTSRQNVRHFC